MRVCFLTPLPRNALRAGLDVDVPVLWRRLTAAAEETGWAGELRVEVLASADARRRSDARWKQLAAAMAECRSDCETARRMRAQGGLPTWRGQKRGRKQGSVARPQRFSYFQLALRPHRPPICVLWTHCRLE